MDKDKADLELRLFVTEHWNVFEKQAHLALSDVLSCGGREYTKLGEYTGLDPCLISSLPEGYCGGMKSCISPSAWEWMALATSAMEARFKLPDEMLSGPEIAEKVCRFSRKQWEQAKTEENLDLTTCPQVVEEVLQDRRKVRAAATQIAYTQGLIYRLLGAGIPVYRGIQFEQAQQLKEALEHNRFVELPTRPVSSWSLSPEQARDFAGEGGALIKFAIEPSQVVHSSLTSPNCLQYEEEIGIWQEGKKIYKRDVEFLPEGHP